MQAKEALVRAHAFPKPPDFPGREVRPAQGLAHTWITQTRIQHALFCQSPTKAPGPDKFNFRAIRLLWNWEPERITAIVQNAVQLHYHPVNWKRARGILLEKGNKRDKSLVKSYRVISLLNCMGKLVEKVIAEELSRFYEINLKLHKGQMGARKSRCAIDAAAIMVNNVHKIWGEKKITASLLMDVKGAFNYVSRVKLARQMRQLRIDNDLIGWTQSFLTDRRVEIVIDGHINPEKVVETGIPQGSPVSPILFLIYISGVFEAVKEKVPEIISLSFMDDLGFLASGNSIQEVASSLEKTGETVLRWGLSNAVTYDIAKTEVILFLQTRSKRFKDEISAIRLTFGEQEVRFNNKATRWLGIWLDSALTFSTHIRERVKQAQAAEARIRSLTRTYGFLPELVRKIQIAAVQAIALFGAEIWWHRQKIYQEHIQKLFNRQGRAITGMY